MKKVCDYKICTGCGLCAAQCPKKCISMDIDDSLGHLYPKISQDVCIDCGLCQKNCPAIHPLELKKADTAYAAWSKDEDDYKSSTSGGAASVLSQYVLSQKGVVYGCAMLPDIEVKHIRVDRLEDVWKLKGSKYVQSNIVEAIPTLKKDVNEGRLTLFVGTPCQVAAIKKLFKEQPDNLLLVDLICHGVTSLDILKKHVHRVANYPNYDKIVFRDSSSILIEIIVKGNSIYRVPFNKPRYKDWYINTFFDGYTYKNSCYTCRYACPERVSDITIGDFWGLGKKTPADEIPSHPYGCSVILPNTQKGKDTIHQVAPKINLYERTVEEAVNGNDQLRFPSPLGKRKRFFRILFPYIGTSAYRLAVIDKYMKYSLKRIIKKIIRK